VSAAAYTQSNSVGADITGSTGANTVTGTAYADTIRTGAGADTIIVNTGTVANSDVIDGGADTDTLQIATGLTYTQATNASLALVEVISLVGTASVVLTGQTEGFTINGGTGVNSITSSGGADTITGGAGADIIQVTATGDRLVYTALTDSASGATGIALVSGTTVVNNVGTNVGLDVITFASTPATGNTLVFDFSAFNSATYTAGAITPATAGSGLVGTTAAAVGVLIGATNAGTGVFTVGAGGATTSMIQVDTDAAAAGVLSITVVGVVVSAALSAGGILTLTF
jgi:Ca2+-binding RTX toxin-like protein